MNLLKLLMLLIFTIQGISQETILVSSEATSQELLSHSDIWISKNKIDIQDIEDVNFQKSSTKYINLGLTKKNIWVKFTLANDTTKALEKRLVIGNPMLVFYKLFHKNTRSNEVEKIIQKRDTLSPSFLLTLSPKSKETFYLYISSYSSVKFSLTLEDKNLFEKKNLNKKVFNIAMLSVIMAMIIYNFLLFMLIHKKEYLYYSIYLFLLIWLEISYIGLSQNISSKYIIIDHKLLSYKVLAMTFFYYMYIKNFLGYNYLSFLYKIMVFLIFVELFNLFVPIIPYPVVLAINLILAIFFLLYIFFISIYNYYKGDKKSRFFIIGFTIVLIAYTIMIFDALGIISIVYEMQNILILATVIEAIFLSISFIDSYKLLAEEKQNVEHKRLLLIQKHKVSMEEEVLNKTKQLKHALATQELLFNELHHRVKNNLQLILSITRLQQNNLQSLSCKRHFNALENRINAIAATHNIIYLSEELEIVSMKEYLTELIDGLKAADLNENITINYDINLNMTLKNAINIGIIVNELVLNSIKHAFNNQRGIINIILKNGYLEIGDNGKGYNHLQDANKESLGLQLVKILVYEQLHGSVQILSKNGTKFIIRFNSEY